MALSPLAARARRGPRVRRVGVACSAERNNAGNITVVEVVNAGNDQRVSTNETGPSMTSYGMSVGAFTSLHRITALVAIGSEL